MEETIEIPAAEAAELEKLLDEYLPEIQRMLKEIERNQAEAALLQAETEAILKQLRAVLL